MKINLFKKSGIFSFKTLIMTKITFLLTVVAMIQVQAKSFGQKITLTEKNSSLSSIIEKIISQTKYDFVYNAPMLKDAKSVNIQIKDKDIRAVLDICFAGQPLEYTITDNTVIVRRRPIERVTAPQQTTLKGNVINERGIPFPGVSIHVKGTSKRTVSDSNGGFTFQDVAPNSTIVVSYLGYASQEIALGNRTTIQVTLKEQPQEISNVVVTALGIKRQKRELGYAVSDVSGDDISGFGEANPIASLAGKVAGVDISTTSAGPSGSSRVVIRGIRELQGNNQPLYVIDGVPAINGNIGSANQQGGYDLGDGLADINPNDIENISVLKGASAAALYGARALNGVILITTKSGKGKKGIGIEVNSSLTTDHISTKQEDVQKIYGQGNNGLPHLTPENARIFNNWGPRYTDLDSIVQRDGTMRPYKFIENNVEGFFRTGITNINTLSLQGGNDYGSLRFSYSNVNSKDIIPKSGYDRNNFSFKGDAKLTDKITMEVKASLMRENVKNRPALSDELNNIGTGLIGLAGNFDQSWLQAYEDEEGRHINYTGNEYRANPYWTLNKTKNDSDKMRVGGGAVLNYQINENWNASLSAGTDFYNFDFKNFYDLHTPARTSGQLQLNDLKVREDNYQAMVNFKKELNTDWKVGAMLGGNIMKYDRKQMISLGSQISAPGIDLINNFEQLVVKPLHPRKENQSLFGSFELGYKNYLFLNLQGRNDWSSTLPKESNSYFYPSADLSFVVSDAFDIKSSYLRYAKLRTSFGQVGSDADPYRTRFMYAMSGMSIHGYPMGEILGSSIPKEELKPQRKTSFELGADIGLFNDRVGLDITYYNEITDNVLVDLPIPKSAGYDFAFLNAAKLKNSGFEVLLRTTPLALSNGLKWDLSFNFSKNYNTVQDFYVDVDAYTVAQATWANVNIIAEKGKPFGTIIGNTYQRNERGEIIHGVDGLPLFTNAPVSLGSSLPDWTGGLINQISFKGISLKAVLDIRKGGSIYSMSNLRMYAEGRHLATLGGRDSWNSYQQEIRAAEQAGLPTGGIQQDGRGFIGEGVNEQGEKNTVPVNPSNYWQVVSGNIPSEFVYDASYIKLRDIGINYTLPKAFIKNLPLQQLSIGVIGRNLWTIHKKVKNIDPESNYNNGNGQGFEYGSLPGRRNFGFNLKAVF